MNRREFMGSPALFALTQASGAPRIEIPVLRLVDRNARCGSRQVHAFVSTIWNQAMNVFANGGIVLRARERDGQILQYPSGKPLFRGLDRGAVNVILSDRVPLDWDKGRSLAGISALYEGYCVSVISMNEAHGNQIPFISVNTVVHELLHVLLGNVFEARTGIINGQTAEARVDAYATRLWLFHDGATVRDAARACFKRLETTRALITGPPQARSVI